jgi:hypothetical protein
MDRAQFRAARTSGRATCRKNRDAILRSSSSELGAHARVERPRECRRCASTGGRDRSAFQYCTSLAVRSTRHSSSVATLCLWSGSATRHSAALSGARGAQRVCAASVNSQPRSRSSDQNALMTPRDLRPTLSVTGRHFRYVEAFESAHFVSVTGHHDQIRAPPRSAPP